MKEKEMNRRERGGGRAKEKKMKLHALLVGSSQIAIRHKMNLSQFFSKESPKKIENNILLQMKTYIPLKAEIGKSKVGIILSYEWQQREKKNSYQAFGAKTKVKPKNL